MIPDRWTGENWYLLKLQILFNDRITPFGEWITHKKKPGAASAPGYTT
jgi:hypothetical protein